MPPPEILMNKMKRIFQSITILSMAITVGLGFAAPAKADNHETGTTLVGGLTRIDCTTVATKQTGNPNTPDAEAAKPEAASENLLFNLLTYRSLHDRLLCDPLISGQTASGQPTISVYRIAQNLVNLGVLLLLLVIGFANILRIKLDTYAVKKSIPLLIFGVIMANIGLPIIRAIVDFSGVLSATFIYNVSPEGSVEKFVETLIKSVYMGGLTAIQNAFTTMDGGTGWAALLGLVGFGAFAAMAFGPAFIAVVMGVAALIFIPAILFLTLGLLFVARIYVLVILAAISPVAFASLGFEPLKGVLWSRWWKEFIRWTFMAPMTFFLLWLATRFYLSTTGAAADQMDLGTYIITIVLIMYAIRTPLSMGGSIMGKWNDMVAKPIQGLLMKPFSSSMDYVKSASPRDTSRFLSSKSLKNLVPLQRFRPFRAIANATPAIPLNIVRATKETLNEIEKSNAAKEARSLAVTRGQFVGQLMANAGTGPLNAALRYGKLKDEYYSSAAGREHLLGQADEFHNKYLGKDVDRDGRVIDSSPILKESLQKGIKEALASGDPEKIAAAQLSLATYGRKGAAEYRQLADALQKKLPDAAKAIDDMATRLQNKSTNLPMLADSQVAKSLDGFNEQVAQQINRFTNVVENLRRDPEKQDRTLQQMLDQLRVITKDFTELKEIEKHPDHLAMANVLISRLRTLPSDTQDTVRRHLIPRRFELGAASAQEVLGANRTGLQTSFGGQPIQWGQFQPLVQGNGLNADILRSLDDQRQQSALRSLVADPAKNQAIKESLRQFVERQIQSAVNDGIMNTIQAGNFNSSVLNRLIDNRIGSQPKKVEASHFTSVGLTEEQAARIIARLRPYQATVNSLDYLHSTGRGVGAAAQNTINGAGTPTAPPGRPGAQP